MNQGSHSDQGEAHRSNQLLNKMDSNKRVDRERIHKQVAGAEKLQGGDLEIEEVEADESRLAGVSLTQETET